MLEIQENQKTPENDFGVKIEDMIEAGLNFGHKTSKIHPKMKPYLYGVRNNIHIIDVEKSAQKIIEALEFIKEIILSKIKLE